MFLLNNKLGARLLINIVITIAIIIALVGFSVSGYMKQNLEEELTLRLEAENGYAVHQIENLFEDASTFVRQLSVNPTVTNYLKELDTREDIAKHPNFANVLIAMNAIERSSENVFLVWLAGEKVNYYLDDDGYYPDDSYDVYKRPWHEVALRPGEMNFTDPYIEWSTKERVVSTIKTLNFSEEGNRHFLVVDFSLSILPEVIRTIDVGSKGHVYLINGEGQYIYHQNEAFVLNESIYDEVPELGQSITDVSQSLDLLNYQDDEYYTMIQPVGFTDWRMVTMVNQSELHSGLNRFIVYLISTLIFISIVSLIGIYVLIKRKLKPIDALADYSESIAAGELDSAPPYEYALLNDEMGTMARSFVTITEVFEQKNKQLEEIVSSQYEEIKQQYHYIIEKEKIASLGVLVAGVAHEINTPLGNGVTTSSYMQALIKKMQELYDDQKLSKTEFHKILDGLSEASILLLTNLERASDLVKQFKTIATNQNIETIKKIDLKLEIDKILKSLRPTTRKRNIKIINEVDEGISMQTYPGAISQVLTNFIINSLHHGFEEEEEGHVIISGRREGDLVRLQYYDDGKGIDDNILNHIFEPFYTTRRSKNNSGLGMYITHNLVNQTLSGTIHCESQSGEGVTFNITLPLVLKPIEPS